MLLKVLTYNIHRAIGVDRRFRPERIINVLDHHQADVVLLQEVDMGVPRSRKLDLAKVLAEELDYPHYTLGLNVQLRTGYYGNATLSRFPIVKKNNIDLTVGTRKRRGCQQTTLQVQNGTNLPHKIHVFNLHLGLSAHERSHQIGLLAQSVEYASLEHDQHCIIGGDFNDWRSLLNPVFTDILGFQSATKEKSGRRSSFRTYPAFSPAGSLDRIYYRGGLRNLTSRTCRLGVSKIASDHLPVISEFELDS